MRLAALSLIAFGPFTNVSLDLSAPGAIHVLYGPNEAGKSTALRAISGLLYGIPHLSPDAHTHRPEDLRVGARLVTRAGAELTVIRRKGRVRTLLDEAGSPLAEHALLPFLGGITEEVFHAAFGLDHETLRLGAQALLEGRGHLGESLFGAGLGGTGITPMLEALRKEADDLYSPLARTRKLNLALRAVVEARKRAQSAAMPPAAWLAQEQAIREAHADRSRLEEEAQRLRTEDRRLRRSRNLLALLAQLRAARASRDSLGPVTLLPEDAPADRTLAESELEAAAAQIRRAEDTRARLTDQRDALTIPYALLTSSDAIEDIATRLGSHRKAEVDLPRVRAELRAQEEEATEFARTLGLTLLPQPAPPVAPAAAPPPVDLRAALAHLRVEAARDERIRVLAREAPLLTERVRHAADEAHRTAAHESTLRARVATLPRPRDLAPLRRAEARARSLGDIAAALDRAERAAALLAERATAARAALSLDALPFDRIPRLPLPLPETVDLFAAEDRGLRRARRPRSPPRRGPRRPLAHRSRPRRSLLRRPPHRGPSPRRPRRTARTADLRAALTRADLESAAAALVDLESATAAADEAADRLRAEADHIARPPHRRARGPPRRPHRPQVRRAPARRAPRSLRRPLALPQPTQVPPRSPEEMRGWLRRHDALVALIDQSTAARAEHTSLLALVATHTADLRAALTAAPVPSDASPDAPPDGLRETPPDGLRETPPDGLRDTPPDGLRDTPPDEARDTRPDGRTRDAVGRIAGCTAGWAARDAAG
ncbi:MAG: AAA family ATPase [Polyangiaceae bacterium]